MTNIQGYTDFTEPILGSGRRGERQALRQSQDGVLQGRGGERDH